VTPTDQNDVFVSYTREDRLRVEPLVTCLRGAGLDVWWDADIPAGSSWRAEILNHLHGAKCVVVVWSEASVSSVGEFVHEEATFGKQRGVLLPVAIDAVAPPLGFGQIQSLDLSGWTGDSDDVRVANVSAAARAIVAGGPRLTPISPVRRAWRVAAAMGLVLTIIGFLANIASLQSAICSVPGIRSACGTVGLGGAPTPAEERAWASRPTGDCTWLRGFVARYPTGAYSEQAARLLQVRRTIVEESWQPEEHRPSIRVSPPLSGFRTERAARADAMSRGDDQAALACGGFNSGIYRLNSARIAEESIKWQCQGASGRSRCSFDAHAICAVAARHMESRELCD
jgi:hypothetical protein